MYNSKQKEDFILDYLNSKIVSESMVRATFKFTEKYEIKYNKDASIFNKNEIIKMLQDKKSRSSTSLNNFIITLKHYTTFVMNTSREIILQNNYMLINKDILRSCVDIEKKNKAIITQDELREIESQMLNATDKAIMECLFVGITGYNLQDLTGLCDEQLDKNKKCIYFSDGRSLQISNYLCNLLEESFEETEMISYGENMMVTQVSGRGRLYKEKPNAYKIANDERKYRWVLRRLVIWRNYFDMPILTSKTISTSGLVDEIKKAMQKTQLPLRDFLKTSYGEEIARRRGFKAINYIDVVYECVSNYI